MQPHPADSKLGLGFFLNNKMQVEMALDTSEPIYSRLYVLTDS